MPLQSHPEKRKHSSILRKWWSKVRKSLQSSLPANTQSIEWPHVTYLAGQSQQGRCSEATKSHQNKTSEEDLCYIKRISRSFPHMKATTLQQTTRIVSISHLPCPSGRCIISTRSHVHRKGEGMWVSGFTERCSQNTTIFHSEGMYVTLAITFMLSFPLPPSPLPSLAHFQSLYSFSLPLLPFTLPSPTPPFPFPSPSIPLSHSSQD